MSVCAKLRGLIIKLVNPRLVNFSKPLLLAVCIAALTFLFFIIIFLVELGSHITTTACNTDKSEPQQIGALQIQEEWIRKRLRETGTTEQVEGDATVEITKKVSVCLRQMEALTTGEQHEKVWYQLSLRAQLCKPPHQWLQGYGARYGGGVSDGGDGKTYWDQKGDPPRLVCDHQQPPDPGKIEWWSNTYRVPESSGPWPRMSQFPYSAAKRAEYVAMGRWPNECPNPWNRYGQTMPVVASYRLEVRMCTTTKIKKQPMEALGTAFAYSGYIEVVVTAALIVCLLGCRCITQKPSVEEQHDARIQRLEKAMNLSVLPVEGGQAPAGSKAAW